MHRLLTCALIVLSLAINSVWADTRETRSGWSVAEENGIQWLVTPEGKQFYSKGVNIVYPGKETEKSKLKQAYCWTNFYPSTEEWCGTVGNQLRLWGFNTLGAWSDPSPQLGLPLTVDLELGRNSKFHWFDPFHPAMEERVFKTAEELTAPYRDNSLLLGYYSDNEVGWWNAALFTWYLGAGWENHTKRKLWNLLVETYSGDWNRLLEDWVPEGEIKSFQQLQVAGAVLKLRPGGNGIRVVNRFMALCAQRYYELMYKAIKKVHPEALVLGDRLPLYYHQDAVRAIGDNIDIISTNYNVDVADGWVAPYFFEGLERLSKKPVLITEFFFAAEENRSGNRNETARNVHAKPGHLMTVETQAERTWGASRAILNFARFPNVVGAHWFQYADEPLGGREDGEDYNMGLIDTSNRPYEELTRMFAALNPTLESEHRKAHWESLNAQNSARLAKSEGKASGKALPIFRSELPISITDQSLLDWDKRLTRLLGFTAPEPYVPFGDIHMAWRPEGLYFASIANTYVNPQLLAYSGEFPSSEAFQLHLRIDAGKGSKEFVICLLPRTNPEFPDGFEVVPQILRKEPGGNLEQLPTREHVQRLEKSLPHMMIEFFLPAHWLGMERLEGGQTLQMNLLLSSYYREFNMALAGKPHLGKTEMPPEWRTFVLEDATAGLHKVSNSTALSISKNRLNPASGS